MNIIDKSNGYPEFVSSSSLSFSFEQYLQKKKSMGAPKYTVVTPGKRIQDSLEFWTPRHGFRIQIVKGFRIPWAVFQIPRGPIFRIPESLPWGDWWCTDWSHWKRFMLSISHLFSFLSLVISELIFIQPLKSPKTDQYFYTIIIFIRYRTFCEVHTCND